VAGGVFGDDSDVELTDDITPIGYETEGTIPGLDESTDELVVFVHGNFATDSDARRRYKRTATALTRAGAVVPVVGFSYDADVGRFAASREIARRNGRKLASFVSDVLASDPGTTIRLIGHSLGTEVLLNALDTARRDGMDRPVESVTLLGGGLEATAVTEDGRFGDAIDRMAGQVDNCYKRDDMILGSYGDDQIGLVGADGPTPETYTDLDVTDDVFFHTTFPNPRGGCLDEVVDRW